MTKSVGKEKSASQMKSILFLDCLIALLKVWDLVKGIFSLLKTKLPFQIFLTSFSKFCTSSLWQSNTDNSIKSD
jgi:hypothetical protein